MSAEDNKQIVREQMDAISRGDYEAMTKYVAEDIVNHDPPPGQSGRGLKAVQDGIRMLHSSFSDYRVAIKDLVAEGDKVAVLFTTSGRHTGPFLGSQPTGKEMSVESLMLVRIEDDKIVERWAQIDMQAMIDQLGLQPSLRRAA
jgi:steroid delta-isomerase-like uncharacterized protein